MILLILFVFGIHTSAQIQQDSTAIEAITIPSNGSDLMQHADRLDSLSFDVVQNLDSLNPGLLSINSKIDSIKNRINFRIDSLNSLSLPSERYTQLLDSLNQLGPAKTIGQAESRMTELQKKVDVLGKKFNRPTNRVESAVNDKLNLMKQEGGEGANLPSNLDLPGAEVPALELPDNNLGLKGESGAAPSSGEESIPGVSEIPGLKELNKAQQGLGEVSRVTDEISAYTEDVKSISSGNLDEVKKLPEALEAQAVKAVDVGQLQEQDQVVDQYKGVLANGNNPEALKQEAVKKIPKMAANHFQGKEEELQQAIDKVNSYKNKYTELTGLENIPKRQPNEMKGKPFVERLLPSITFQIQNSKNFMLDYNAALGYRLSKRFIAGLGWNERVGITNKIGFTLKDRVYGPRTFFEFKVRRGFGIRADVEKLNAFVPPDTFNQSDFGGRQWIASVFVGMKKEYDFIKSVKGNFQFLCNLYDDHNHSPYASRLVVRFGFEFPMKKKVIDQ